MHFPESYKWLVAGSRPEISAPAFWCIVLTSTTLNIIKYFRFTFTLSYAANTSCSHINNLIFPEITVPSFLVRLAES